MISRNDHRHSVAQCGFDYDRSRISGSFQSSNDSSLDLSRPRLKFCVYPHQIRNFRSMAFGCALSVLRTTGRAFVYLLDLFIPKSYIPVNNFFIPKTMSAKMGRPRLPKGQAKDFQIGVRFTRKEAEKIKKAISETGLSNANWARNALIQAASS